MDAFSNLYVGFSIALSFQNLLYCFMGCLVGTVIGVLPGIGPVSTIAILSPLLQYESYHGTHFVGRCLLRCDVRWFNNLHPRECSRRIGFDHDLP